MPTKTGFDGIVQVVFNPMTKFITVSNEVVIRFLHPEFFANPVQNEIGLRARIGLNGLKNPKQRFLDFIKDSMNMVGHDGDIDKLIALRFMPKKKGIKNQLGYFRLL